MNISHYSRIFTDVLPNAAQRSVHNIAQSRVSTLLLHLVIVWLVTLTVFLGISSYVVYSFYQNTSSLHTQEEQRLAYWESVIRQRSDYPAAYYQAAVSSVRLHDPLKALGYLQKALLLDPNFSQAEVFAQEIERER